MSALAALFGFLLLFGGHHAPKCPPLQEEVTNLYVWQNYARYLVHGEVVQVDSNKSPNATSAPTLIEFGTRLKLIGTTTDEKAVEHNKRVRECQTVNGEF